MASASNCLWSRQWRIIPNHEPKLLIAIRLIIICLLSAVFLAYTGYLINQWRNPLLLHRTYWAPRPFHVPPISLEGATYLMRNASWQASARVATASNSSVRVDLTQYLRWTAREENMTTPASDDVWSEGPLTRSMPLSQLTLTAEEWWRFGRVAATPSADNATNASDDHPPLFLEISIIATSRRGAPAPANAANADQSLRLIVHGQSQDVPFAGATHFNQMPVEWASAYQVQLTDTRHIDSQSVEARSVAVDGTPYAGPPVDGIALRIRPGNNVLSSTDSWPGDIVHGSRDESPAHASSSALSSAPLDQFVVEVSEDVPRLSPLELIACWGGVGMLIMLLYGFLLGSRRLRPWGVVQRYLLPGHMKQAGFVTGGIERSFQTTQRAKQTPEAGAPGQWRSQMPKGAIACLSRCLMQLHRHPHGPASPHPAESAPPVTVSSVPALPPPVRAAPGVHGPQAHLQPESPADSCSCPATQSSPAVSNHSEPSRWSSAQDRQLYEACHHARALQHANRAAGGNKPHPELHSYPITMSETERIDEEMRMQYTASDNYDPEAHCIFYSPNSFRRRPMPPDMPAAANNNNNTDPDTSSVLGHPADPQSGSVVLEQRGGVGSVPRPTAAAAAAAPPAPPVITATTMTTTTSYPPVMTGTSVTAAVRDNTSSSHIYL
ncbi:hypothetical protein SYNPS1DRAFT_28228 [Syncephalis pseudoplumigaleata]|uniref:Uncharacterized protein n=1 Tax=Syncephalis pseudoplumigaleata TaxID=1712513 RepID=A0A4P9Z270_9FUNG|nr:hypothetical protein SYNPS1DRAFT_28228 [Syncephalis pseudoplumigaleata]|eukprot:RKP26062.1 hypothetical protein SYNPS1DRAFT_28228 [Syncephalis pseudoplumigaleata]